MGNAKLFFNTDNPASVSRAQQHFLKESDINNIINKYRKTGVLGSPVRRPTYFGDFTDLGDFQTVHNKLIEANTAFMTLPAKVRDKFKGNVNELLTFINNPDNANEARELGLLAPLPPKETVIDNKAAGSSVPAGAAGTAAASTSTPPAGTSAGATA